MTDLLVGRLGPQKRGRECAIEGGIRCSMLTLLLPQHSWPSEKEGSWESARVALYGETGSSLH